MVYISRGIEIIRGAKKQKSEEYNTGVLIGYGTLPQDAMCTQHVDAKSSCQVVLNEERMCPGKRMRKKVIERLAQMVNELATGNPGVRTWFKPN